MSACRCGLNGKFAHALQNRGDLICGPFSHVERRNAVLGVSGRLGSSIYLGAQVFGNAKSGGVITRRG